MNRSEENASAPSEPFDDIEWAGNQFGIPEYKYLVYINLVTFIISLFGVAFNILNMVAFYRMGFKENINISLFSLAATDLSSLLFYMWCSACLNPWHTMMDLPYVPLDFWYFGSWLARAATTHSSWVTCLITIERCLCVTIPLKVKLIVTPTLTVVVILVSFVLNVGSILPVIVEMQLEWKLDTDNNKFVLGVTHNRGVLQFSSYVMSTALRLSVFPCLLVATIALSVSLKRKAEWRTQMSVTSSGNLKSLSSRDTKVAQMILVLSCIVLAANSSNVILTITYALNLLFSGRLLCWYFSHFLLSCNSTVNIFFYYKMSGSYRKKFQTLMGIREVGDGVRK